MIAAVCLGFFGSIFALVGMKCTKIGGSDRSKGRFACCAGVSFILSGEWPFFSRLFFPFKDSLESLFLLLRRLLLTLSLLPLRAPDHVRVL